MLEINYNNLVCSVGYINYFVLKHSCRYHVSASNPKLRYKQKKWHTTCHSASGALLRKLLVQQTFQHF